MWSCRLPRSCRLRAAGAVVLSLACAGGRSAAQAATRPPDECFAVSFGVWDPPLDWSAAGHAGPPTLPPEARGTERGDASRQGLSGDSSIMLYPPWWPAGVLVKFTGSHAAGDTLSGVATALVADGRRRPPRAAVRVVRRPCRAAGPARPAAPRDSS
jgi:hypothetical protein